MRKVRCHWSQSWLTAVLVTPISSSCRRRCWWAWPRTWSRSGVSCAPWPCCPGWPSAPSWRICAPPPGSAQPPTARRTGSETRRRDADPPHVAPRACGTGPVCCPPKIRASLRPCGKKRSRTKVTGASQYGTLCSQVPFRCTTALG